MSNRSRSRGCGGGTGERWGWICVAVATLLLVTGVADRALAEQEDEDGGLADRVLRTLGEDADTPTATSEREQTATRSDAAEEAGRDAVAGDDAWLPAIFREPPRLPGRELRVRNLFTPRVAANEPADNTAAGSEVANGANVPARAAEEEADAPGRRRMVNRQPRQRRSRPEPEPRADEQMYTVQEGDTLSSIAERLLGDEKQWVAIAQANPLVDPAQLRVGEEIRVPSPEAYEAERERQLARIAAAVDRPGASNDRGEDDQATVEVVSGDTLSHIAKRVYGEANAWRMIYEANRDQLDDPGDLKVGMTLRVPPRQDVR